MQPQYAYVGYWRITNTVLGSPFRRLLLITEPADDSGNDANLIVGLTFEDFAV